MKHNITLTISSLLTILFTTFHLTDDIVRGMSPGGLPNIPVVLVLVFWLYGTLVLGERRSGHIIILVASLLVAGLPAVHILGEGGMVGGGMNETSGACFFAWTLIALAVTAIFSAALAARGLRNLHRGPKSRS